MNPYEYVGARIRSARNEKRWSLTDLSKIMGMARTTLSEIERGIIRFNFEKLSRFASVLEKPIQYFLPLGWQSDANLPDDLAMLLQELKQVENEDFRKAIATSMATLIRSCNGYISK